MAQLPPLPTDPSFFSPGIRITAEHAKALDIDPTDFLWPEKRKLVWWLIKTHEEAFAWDASKHGTFHKNMFPPLKIPTVENKPWVHYNIPIPPMIYPEVVHIIKEKVAAGVYEPSTSSYRSCWFFIVKKDGKSLQLVHDL